MARQVAIKKDFVFTSGLNTDAGYLQSVPNSWVEGDNVIPDISGHIRKRVKIDLETEYDISTAFTITDQQRLAFTVHEWKSVGGNGLLTFAVVQRISTIEFYDCVGSSLSPNIKAFTIDLTSYKSPTSPSVFGSSPVSVFEGNGKLIIVSQDTDPILVTYNAVADTITVTRLTLKIRDFYGIPDSTPVTTTPLTLTPAHGYNLLNQGWYEAHISTFFSNTAAYPSDAQIWLQGKDSNDDFSPSILLKQDFGTSPAPKGRRILDVFNRVRTSSYGEGSPAEVEDYRPSTGAFFAGRAWYAGMQSNTIGSWVLFSQIVDTDIKYEQCYQDGDPTAEFTSDLLPNDGGVIPIPGAGGILSLVPLQESLLVFARNGIWQILGDQSGFRADGYQVKQVATFGISAPKSVVNVENTVMFWSTAGIYVMDKDNVSGDFIPKSISLGKIQNLYARFQDESNMAYVQGFYDSVKKVVYWMHNQRALEEADLSVERFRVRNILLLDVTLGAFYTFSIQDLPTGSPIVVGGFLSPNAGDSEVTENIVVAGILVTASAVQVVASTPIPSVAAKIPKFLTCAWNGTGYNLTFSDFVNVEDTPFKFKDWYNVGTGGAEYSVEPYIITNYELLQDGARIHQSPFIVTYMLRTEDGFTSAPNAKNGSGCILQGRWDWTDSAVSYRWTTGQQIYRHQQLYIPYGVDDPYDDGYPLVVAKSKIRGKGKSLQLKFTGEPGKDMKLAGWAVQYSVNQNV